MEKLLESDVVVIGSGIAGVSIARELSQYKVHTVLVERVDSFLGGQSKSAQVTLYRGLAKTLSIVMKSFILEPGQPLYDLKSRMNKEEEEGWKIWHKEWLTQLDIPHRRAPQLVVAAKEQLGMLERTWELGQQLGGIFADVQKVDRAFILKKEPHLNKDVVAGLWSKGHHVTLANPWDQVIALLENAQQNGVRVMRGAKVIGISCNGDIQVVQTTKGRIKTRFIVNAAGLYADRIAHMVGPIDWAVNPQAGGGACLLLDKEVSRELASGKSLIALASDPGLREIMTPTLEGNLYFNCGVYRAVENREGVAVSREEFQSAISLAKHLIPDVSAQDVIRAFNAVRGFHTRAFEEHIVEPHPANPRFINAALRLPGFCAAAAIARYEVPQLLGDAGLELTTKRDFDPYRKGIPRLRDLPDEEKNKLIAQDPKYGHIICRCEYATEGEIVEAIRRGSRTVQDIKFMTRAGMGRCQGAFCGPRVIQILARALDIPVTKVLEREASAVLYEGKELLKAT